jgi:hypothetical protein
MTGEAYTAYKTLLGERNVALKLYADEDGDFQSVRAHKTRMRSQIIEATRAELDRAATIVRAAASAELAAAIRHFTTVLIEDGQ